MKRMNKLVALLLAAVMVLGLFPTVHAHATEYHTHGVEEYPVIELDTPTTVEVSEGGYIAYFAFTPEKTDMYHYYSYTEDYCDTKGAISDVEGNELAYGDEATWGNELGVSNGNFLITYVMEAGVTYVLSAQFYGSGSTGSFPVTVTTAHSYDSAVTKDYTCTEDGVLTWTCIYCGDSYDEPIPAAHKWNEETGICDVCNDTYLIEGICGDNLTWTLDWFGKLTISGTGDMYDFFYSWDANTPSEWHDNYNYDIKSVVIEEGCTSIGEYAFYQANAMAEVTIPASVTEIGAHAFDNTALTAIEVPETVTTLGAGAFASCMSLTSAALPSGLLTIPASCFEYCYELSEVVWPAAATSVGAKAFYNCNLGDLVVPEGIAAIGQSAFGGNSNMTKLFLPSTLAVLEDRAFSSCWGVLDFIFTGNAPVIPEATFYWVTANVWYPADNATWTEDVKQQYNGTLTWKAMCANHSYSEWTSVEATCEVGAYETRSCAACGWVESTPQGEPLGHDLVRTVVELPDCGSYTYGHTEITCTRCDYYEYTWDTPEHEYEVNEVEATCTTDGGTVYTCVKCGSYYTENLVPATGHELGEWSEPSEATCTEASVKTASCSVCGETVTEEVAPALGHTWDEENPVENEDGSKTYTCTVCGDTMRTEGTVLYLGDNVFSIAAGTGTKTKTFTPGESGELTITLSNLLRLNYYGEWSTIATDWAFKNGLFTVAINGQVASYTVEGSEVNAKIIIKTNVTAGDTVTVTLNNIEGDADYTNEDVKVNMNLALEAAAPEALTLTLGDNLFHIAETAAELSGTWTAEKDGALTVKFSSIYYYDSFWAEMFPEDDPWTEMPVENALDNYYYSLSVNGTSVSAVEGTTIDVAAGDVVTVVVGNGYAAETKATVNLSLADPHVHSYTAVVTEPTCTEYGYTTYVCECGESYVDEDSYTEPEHSWDDGVVTAPTCTEQGFTTFTCTACGESYVDEDSYTAALGHAWKGIECENCDATRKNPFTDVPNDSWYIDPVLWAVEQGITTGASDSTFNPNGTCLRAQVVTFLWRAMGKPEPTTTVNPFTDVSESDWYYKAVLWAVEMNITNGTSATTFSPDAECNRAQVVTFLWRALEKPEPTTTESPFTDVNVSDWYGDAVLWAVENKITNGMGDGTFGINGLCNRAQVVTFLYRAMA